MQVHARVQIPGMVAGRADKFVHRSEASRFINTMHRVIADISCVS